MKQFYKELFKREYKDLITHYNELRWFIFKCEHGEDTSESQIELMRSQLNLMQEYIDILNRRAYFDEIEI